MRVLTTPWTRGAMTPEDLAAIEQERPGRDGETLSLTARSAGGPFVAQLYVPDLGEYRGEGLSISAAIVDVIEQVNA